MTMAPVAKRDPVVVGLAVQSGDFPALTNTPCNLCDGELESKKIDWERDFNYEEVWIRVVLFGLPAAVCKKCGIEATLTKVREPFDPILREIFKVVGKEDELSTIEIDSSIATLTDPRPKVTRAGRHDLIAVNCPNECGGVGFLELAEYEVTPEEGAIKVTTEGYRCVYCDLRFFNDNQSVRFERRAERTRKRRFGR